MYSRIEPVSGQRVRKLKQYNIYTMSKMKPEGKFGEKHLEVNTM